MGHRKYERKKPVGAYVRFTLTPDEAERLNRACALDRRSRVEFARLCCIRGANDIISRYGAPDVLDLVQRAVNAELDKKN